MWNFWNKEEHTFSVIPIRIEKLLYKYFYRFQILNFSYIIHTFIIEHLKSCKDRGRWKKIVITVWKIYYKH